MTVIARDRFMIGQDKEWRRASFMETDSSDWLPGPLAVRSKDGREVDRHN